MKQSLVYATTACLVLVACAALCSAAPAPKPRPPKERAILKGPAGGIFALAFSPDGKMLACGHGNKTITLWGVVTGKKLATLSGHKNQVIGLAFSPDGKMLASISYFERIRLWDVPNRKSAAVLVGRWGTARSVIFSLDGKTLITAAPHSHYWDVPSKTLRKVDGGPPFGGPSQVAGSFTYTAEGKLLCLVRENGFRLSLWDVEARKSLRTVRYSKEELLESCAAMSPDQKFVASSRCGVGIWDLTTGKRIGIFNRSRDCGPLAFSPNSKLLAVGWGRNPKKNPGPSEGLSILDPSTGKELATLDGQGNGPCMAFSPDGKTLAVGTGDAIIKLWDVSGVRVPGK